MPETHFTHELNQNSPPSLLELSMSHTPDQHWNKNRLKTPVSEYMCREWPLDQAAQLQQLSAIYGENRFDGVIACAVLEYVPYPWLLAVELCRVLKPGGLLFLQARHTYPLQPQEYWRFTEEGLRTLLGPQIGFKVLASRSETRCHIVSEREPQLVLHPSHLHSLIAARKQHHPATEPLWQADTHAA